MALKKCDEKLVTAFEMWVWRRMLRINRTERKTKTWIREKIGISEEKGILEQIKHRKLSKYCHRKRRSDSVVTILATIEGEIEGKCLPGRRRTAWIDDVWRWTSDDKKIRLLLAGCLRVVRPTAYEQQRKLVTDRQTEKQSQ